MGSYNLSCAITGMPITTRTKDAYIIAYTKNQNGMGPTYTYYGYPMEAEYDDYGRFKILSANPFIDEMKPNFMDAEGLAFLNSPFEDELFDMHAYRAIDLSKVNDSFLHLFHELFSLKTNLVITQLNTRFNTDYNSASDLEGERGISTTNPEQWQAYQELMGSTPTSYNGRASIVHEWLFNQEPESPTNTLELAKQLCAGASSEALVYEKFVKLLGLEEFPKSAQLVKEKFAQQSVVQTISFVAVHKIAFDHMVAMVKKQLGAKKVANLLFKTTQSLEESSEGREFLEHKKTLIQSPDLSEVEILRLTRMIAKFTKKQLFSSSNESPKWTNYMAGLTYPKSDLIKDMILFNELTYHGFRFSTMGNNSQYEGIAHLEAQAKATLALIKQMKPTLYRNGNWEVFSYD